MAVVLLTACASQPPQTTTYLLRSEVPTGPDVALRDSGIALGNIRVANYIDQPGLGKIPVANIPFKMSRTPAKITRSTPETGEHNEEIYGSLLNYTRQDLAALKEEGVI